jgi:hypothetical protein
VLNLIGEVFQSAERDTFLGRVNDIGIANSGMRNNDLRMAFGPQCSALKEGFFKPDALPVNILPRLHVIDCINHKAQVGPEVIIKY